MRKAKLFSLVIVPMLLLTSIPLGLNEGMVDKAEASELVIVDKPCYFRNAWTGLVPTYDEVNANRDHWHWTDGLDGLDDHGRSVDLMANGYAAIGGDGGARPYMSCGTDRRALASISGTVEYTPDWYGITMKINRTDGVSVLYGHLDERIVANGSQVVVGQHIGTIGTTGMANGAHIHFNVFKNGTRLSYSSNYSSLPSQWIFGNAQTGTPFFQTIRGTDNQIYSRVTTNGTSWSSWSPVGTTYDDISSIQFNGVTYQSIRGTNNAVYIRRSSGTSWGPWEYYGGSTTNDVNMEVFNGRLYQAIKGTNDFVHYRSTTDGVNWNAWELGASANITWSDVAMESSNGYLFQAIRGTDEYVYFRKTSGIQFMGGWTKTSIRTDDDITLKDYNGLLYMAAKGKNNEAFLGTYDPAANNFSFTNIGTTRGSIALEVHAGLLYQSYRGLDHSIHTRYTNRVTGASSDWNVAGTALAMPTFRVYNGRIYQAVRGTDNMIYTRSVVYGNSWGSWQLYDFGTTWSEISM